MRNAGKAETRESYLAALPLAQRNALGKLGKMIKAAAPKAEECISYQLCAFRQNGPLVAFGATKRHCAFYVMSGTILNGFKEELREFDTSKGAIRFQPEKPLRVALVRRLVKARIAENKARP